MTPQEELEAKIAITQRGVDAYAKIEQALEEINTGFNELQEVYKDGGAAGMAQAAEVLKTVNAIRKLAGKSADVAEQVYTLHGRATELAKANNADVAIPQGYAVVFGGGGR